VGEAPNSFRGMLRSVSSVSLPLQRALRRSGLRLSDAIGQGRERLRRTRGGGRAYTNLSEELVVRRLLETLGIERGFAVDIAACDGVTNSNAFGLYASGWAGVAVEGDPARFASLAGTYRRFPDVSLARLWVTPDNVVSLLRGYRAQADFAFLNLDIDGYDHFVLAALLEKFRPALICAEINEKIPPPLKFTVLYDPGYVWAEDHFYGQSVSKLHELAQAFGYALVELHYNNAFLVPAERSDMRALSPEEAYASGYLDRPDRLELFPWNADMEELHKLDSAGKVAFVERRFAQYRGKFDLDV
jgi:hypothetical protein